MTEASVDAVMMLVACLNRGRIIERGPLHEAVEAFSGSELERILLADGTSWVVKRIPAGDWIMRATKDDDRAGLLWKSGILANVPPVMDHAVVATEGDADERIIVMRDVRDRLFPCRRVISRAESHRLLVAAGALHQQFWGLKMEGLCSLDDYYGLFSPATTDREQRDENSHARWFGRGWERFADVCPADVSRGVFRILDSPSLLAAELRRCEGTLLHGDLKLANLGLAEDHVVVLDWGSMTGLGPPAVDFAWYLVYNATRIDAPREAVVADFRAAEADRFDSRALELALIGGLAQFGWRKALVATQSQNARARSDAAEDLRWWTDRVRQSFETWSPW